ncbi:MAG: hypothetical protein ACRD1L_13565, partial [Terriglobales bacterium]
MQKFVVLSCSAALACVLAACGGGPTATPGGSRSASGPTPAPSAPAKLLPGAAWLYAAPSGSGLDISGMTAGLSFQLNTHAGGFDYPVAYADGSLGCTTFTDTLQFAYTDHVCVPNPAGGFHPSVGGWGADDGHLIVLDSGAGAQRPNPRALRTGQA